MKIKKRSVKQVISLSCKGNYSNIGLWFGEIIGHLASKGIFASDYLMSVFFDDPRKVDVNELRCEVLVPVDVNFDSDEKFKFKVLDEINVVSEVHKGSIISSGSTYDKILTWLDLEGYKIVGPFSEIYYYDGVSPFSENYEFEIQIPVEKINQSIKVTDNIVGDGDEIKGDSDESEEDYEDEVDDPEVEEDTDEIEENYEDQEFLDEVGDEKSLLKKIVNSMIYVSDLHRSLEFYKNILGLKVMFFDENRNYLQFKVDGLDGLGLMIGEKKGNSVVLTFEVSNVDEVFNKLKSKLVHIVKEPLMQWWGGYYGEFVDPDGNVFGVVEVMK